MTIKILRLETEAIENTHPCCSSTPTPTFVLSSTEASTAPTTPPVICNVYTIQKWKEFVLNFAILTLFNCNFFAKNL